jgi:hypothetical protein
LNDTDYRLPPIGGIRSLFSSVVFSFLKNIVPPERKVISMANFDRKDLGDNAFLRKLMLPEEDRRKLFPGMTPSVSVYRWFRSENVIDLLHYRKRHNPPDAEGSMAFRVRWPSRESWAEQRGREYAPTDDEAWERELRRRARIEHNAKPKVTHDAEPSRLDD